MSHHQRILYFVKWGYEWNSLLLTIGMFCVHVLLSPSSLTLLVLVSTLLAELVRVQLD